jgi:hypothetical protein
MNRNNKFSKIAKIFLVFIRLKIFPVLLVAGIALLLYVSGNAAYEQQLSAVSKGSASLNMNTPGCGTTFTPPACTGEHPLGEEMKQILTGRGQIVITNSGSLPAALASVAVSLEKAHTGSGAGNALGPSGKNWDVLLTAVAYRYQQCENLGVSKTAYGNISETPGMARLFLSQDGQEVSLEDGIVVQPLKLPAGNPCQDPNNVVIDFDYEFDITTLDIEGPGDGLVPTEDDLRINVMVTFGSGGKRSGTVAVDLNCDGLIRGLEEQYARTIQQRFQFDPIACPEWIEFPSDIEGEISHIAVQESSAERLRIKASLPGMYVQPPITMADGNTYTPISAPGCGLSEQGKPALPILGEWILIPNGTQVSLEINPGEPLLFEEMLLPPVQPLAGDCEGELILPFARNETIYGMDADCPGVFAMLEPTKVMRGQDCSILWLHPYQYNPVRKRLTVYPDLSVTVLFDGLPGPIPHDLEAQSFDLMMRRTAINSDIVLAAEKEYQKPIEEPYDKGAPMYGPYGWDYIIVTRSTFKQAADNFSAWKDKLGFKSTVFEVPDLWFETDIKKTLEGAYKNWGRKPKYILIIGDAEFIPTFHETWHYRNISNPVECECVGTTKNCTYGRKNDQDYTASDLYYTTMEGDDIVPEMFIGRLSVDSPEQAMKRVNDIIQYEQNPVTDSSFYARAAICANFEDVNLDSNLSGTTAQPCKPDGYEDKRFTQTSEDMARFLTDKGKLIDRIYYTEPSSNPIYWNKTLINFGGGPAGNPGDKIPSYLWRQNGFPWNGSGEQIVNAINGGRFLLTYRGHGARDHWRAPKFDAQNFTMLNNGSKLPVVWSFSCQTGWFDNETDFAWSLGEPPKTDYTSPTEVCFSEQWERRPSGGAIGIVAGTRITSGYLNEYLSWGMMDAIWPDFLPKHPSTKSLFASKPILRMGEVLFYGKQAMMTTIAGDPKYYTDENLAKKTNYEAYHWFGDPAMEIRVNRPPVAIAASFPHEWPWQLRPWPFSVLVEKYDPSDPGNVPLKDATVTITKADSRSEYWAGITDAEGNVTFPDFVAMTSGTYDVVVSAPDSPPFQGTFTSEPGTSGGILLDAKVYRCGSEVEIRVADTDVGWFAPIDVSNEIVFPPDNANVRTLAVAVTTSGGDEETVLLQETGEGSGTFVGGIATELQDVVMEDGMLQVVDKESLFAGYSDVTGSDEFQWIETTALIDCNAPGFDGVQSASYLRGRVVLEWEPASDPHGPITYKIYRSESAEVSTFALLGTSWALSYPDYDCVPGKTYYYMVRAQDAAGNEDDNFITKSVVVDELPE